MIPTSIKSYSRATAAEILAVSERQVDRLIRDRSLKAYRVGTRGLRVTEDSIHSLIQARMLPDEQTV